MSTKGDYIIDSGMEGKKRLNVLSEVLYATTRSLLLENGLSQGMSFLDAGCGGGNVALMAAKIVGNNGIVTGIDFDPEIIALNARETAEKGISNIRYQAADIYDIPYQNEFDIAYARFLLSHLQKPELALSNMLRSIKPGGCIIVEDVHFSGHFCYPSCPAFDQYVQLYTIAALQRKQHPEIGPSLPHMFLTAGMVDVKFEVIQPTFTTGLGKWMAWITMDRIKDALITQGLLDLSSINEILSELDAFTRNEDSIISMPRIFRVSGRKS